MFVSNMTEMRIIQSDTTTWYSKENFWVFYDTLASWPVEHLSHDITYFKHKTIIVLQKHGHAPKAKYYTVGQDHS